MPAIPGAFFRFMLPEAVTAPTATLSSPCLVITGPNGALAQAHGRLRTRLLQKIMAAFLLEALVEPN